MPTPIDVYKRQDIVIVNDGNLDQFREQLAYQYNKLLKERAWQAEKVVAALA